MGRHGGQLVKVNALGMVYPLLVSPLVDFFAIYSIASYAYFVRAGARKAKKLEGVCGDFLSTQARTLPL